ncbi:MAG TPA: C39 family peptidase, partial [Acidimicrobiales bacterium]
SMVLGYYDALPGASAYSWVPAGHVDPWVDHAARMTYDADYAGTGNWPFNTAYAATLTDRAFVTRLRSLREAERFIAAGIPLVASIAFGRGELDGAPISASAGHLLVIVGFTDTGDVVVNDPAAPTRAGVRRTYDRGQFEDAWIPASGGTVYVITDDAHPLPANSPGSW